MKLGGHNTVEFLHACYTTLDRVVHNVREFCVWKVVRMPERPGNCKILTMNCHKSCGVYLYSVKARSVTTRLLVRRKPSECVCNQRSSDAESAE